MIMKLQVFSLTFQKHLIKSETMVLYSDYKKGISGNLLKVFETIENKGLNRQSSSWINVKAGVPQGSILEALLFWIYINNLANKQAQEVIFSRKLKKFCHPTLRFNNNNVSQASSQKHLGFTLDNRLTFDKHLKNVSNKTSKTIGLLRKLQNTLPRPVMFRKTPPTRWWYYLWSGLQLILPSKIIMGSIQCFFSHNRGNSS